MAKKINFSCILMLLGANYLQLCSAWPWRAAPIHTGWNKISQAQPVCVEPRDKGYGHLQYNGTDKLVAALKLEYESGAIRCAGEEAPESRWGCPSKKYPLNIIVTDETNYVIFPVADYLSEEPGMWYSMPFVDATDSDELVFADFALPFYLSKGDGMRFWYGEYLTNHATGENKGQVCFHVFAMFK